MQGLPVLALDEYRISGCVATTPYIHATSFTHITPIPTPVVY
ncbi:hypothetical protein SAMN04489860_0783 [Paraoerskovia marina]|uniref:Uncharacterized protein n=1 Tax=Paraoerskovia marina TaxID=545619 RepID=A0A1H1PE05_9CELL|nr:hypothetical protein SAMN04489860_0783 [Paraoerskovia marina]